MRKPSWSQGPLRLLPVAIGVALLVHLVARTGAATIVEAVKAVGWGLLLIIALGGLAHLLWASAWRLAFRCEASRPSLARAFGLRLIAEAGGTLGLAGEVIGDSTRISLLGPMIPMPDRISSVALDRAAYMVSSGVVTVTGMVAALMLLSLTGKWRLYAVAFAVIVTVVLLLGIFSFARGRRLFSSIMHSLQRLPWGQKWLAEKTSVVESTEDSLLSFRSRAPRSFWTLLGLYLGAQMLAIAEVYILLHFMGVGIALVGAFVIEAFTKLVNTVGALNPGNVGTYEGGNLLLARLLGFTSAAGLTLALCRRARILFWAGVGACYFAAWGPRKDAEISRASI